MAFVKWKIAYITAKYIPLSTFGRARSFVVQGPRYMADALKFPIQVLSFFPG